jgi:hypothetical protein
MSAKLTQRDVERLRDSNPVQLWADINQGKFAQPKVVRGQKQWSVDDVIRSGKPHLVIDVRRGRIL